jgi:MFS family permease
LSIEKVKQSPKIEPKFFYGYFVVVAALFILLAANGAQVGFGVFFKPLVAEFGWTRAVTSGAFSLNMIMQGLIGIVMGRLNDRLGPRMVLTVCGFFLGIGYLLTSQVGAVWQLYLFYGFIIGIGMSGTAVPLMSTVARWFVARRGVMTGIIMNGMGIGGLIAPLAIYWLIQTYDWRMSFMVVGGFVFVVVVLLAQFLRRDPAQMGQMAYGETERGEQRLNLTTKGFSLGQAFSTRQFWLILGMFFCLAFSIQVMLVHIAPHATDLGISAATAAGVLATLGGVSIVGRIAMGSIADRIGNMRVFIICFAAMSAALFWLASATEVWVIYLCTAIFALTCPGAIALTSPIVAELFGLKSHGLILGVTMFGFTVGAAVGPFLAGYIFDVTSSYKPAFIVCAALSIVGLVLAVILRPTTDERDKGKAI